MTPYESAWDGRQNTGEAVEFNEGDDYLDRVRPALYEAQDSDEYHYEVAIFEREDALAEYWRKRP